MATVSLACHAMATRFELVLHGADANALRAAGEAALQEVTRLEAQLSLYRPGSEIAQVNARAARAPVRVSPEVFGLLQHALRLAAETRGAFDPTVAPLVRGWGLMHGPGRRPGPEEIATARECVGWEKIELAPADCTVRFARDGMMLDLGAIGKGFAVERAAGVLREAGVASGLIHGGTSTIGAIGRPPDAGAWKIVVDVDAELERRAPPRLEVNPGPERAAAVRAAPPAFTLPLADESLSVSAPTGREFELDGKRFGHVLDPRTGQPADAALLAAVVAPSATESDAFSTALLVLGVGGTELLASLRPGVKTMLVRSEAGQFKTTMRGFRA